MGGCERSIVVVWKGNHLYEQIKDIFEAVVLSAVSIIVLVWAVGTIQSRQHIARARARGLWPPLGYVPTDEDLSRLVKSGETILAIKMCRQIHNMGFSEASAVVERMSKQSS